tara:strand:- start:178 stop:294 length:117 start_codon:yes stop_codon:yes gene_type:complete
MEYTDNQKKLIKILYPDKYKKLWPEVEEPKKEEEQPAE